MNDEIGLPWLFGNHNINSTLTFLRQFFPRSGFAGPIIGGVLLDLEGYEYSTGWIAFILSVGVR